MAFDINARLRISSVANLTSIANDIRREVTRALQNVPITATINISGNAASVFQNLSNSIGNFSRSLQSLQGLANTTANSLSKLYQIQGPISATSNINNYGIGLQQLGLKAKEAAFSFEQFGAQAGLAVRRFLAFSIAAGGIISLVSAIGNGIRSAVQFNSEMVRVAQVSEDGAAVIGRVSEEITRVATTYGVSSLELAKAAVIIKQAGFTSEQTAQSLQVLAQAALSPNFGSMEDNVRGLVAVMGQFKLSTTQAAEALNAINAVAAATTVDAKDIVEAISKAGGAFATVGGDYREFIAIFTSIKNVTQESAESIGTGLRTIFARLQDANNVTALDNLNIKLRRTREEADALNRQNIPDGRGGARRFYEGEFVGPNEAIRRIQRVTSQVDPNSPQFSEIISRLGGQRQISRVLPLLQEGRQQQQLLNVINSSQLSLDNSTKLGLTSVENQLTRVTEKFLSLFRTVGGDRTLLDFKDLMVGLAVNIGGTNKGLLDFAQILTPIIPLIATIGAAKLTLGALPFVSGIANKFGIPPSTNIGISNYSPVNSIGTNSYNITNGGINLRSTQLSDASRDVLLGGLQNRRGGQGNQSFNNFFDAIQKDILAKNPNIGAIELSKQSSYRSNEVLDGLRSQQRNNRDIRALEKLQNTATTPLLQRVEIGQQISKLRESNSTIQQNYGVSRDTSGNIIGIGNQALLGQQNDLTRANRLDRRNLLLASGLTIAGGIIAQNSGNVDDAIRNNRTGAFTAISSVGGATTGAGIGAGLGSTIAVGGGPVGAVIGAAILGLQSFTSSLDEIRRANIAKTFTDIANAQGRLLENLERGNVLPTDISANQRFTSDSIRQNVYLRENTLESYLAYFTGNSTQEMVNTRGGEATRLSLQQTYSRPDLVRNNTSLVQREISRLLREDVAINLNGGPTNRNAGTEALNRISDSSSNNPYRNNLQLLAYSQGYLKTQDFINSDDGRRLSEQVRLDEVLAQTSRQFNLVNNDLINFALGIKRINETFNSLENSINASIAVSQGGFANARVASPNLENLLGSGQLFNSLSDLPQQYLTGSLRNRLGAIDAVGSASSIVSRDLSRAGSIPSVNTGENFAGYITNQIQNQNPNAFNNDEGRQILNNIRDRLGARFGTNTERQRELINNPEELQKEINDVFRSILGNVQSFADSYRQTIQREIQIRNEGNKLLVESISQFRLANNASLAAYQQRAQFQADNSLRGNELVRFMTQRQADRPFNSQLTDLLNPTSVNADDGPASLSRSLQVYTEQYNNLSRNPAQNRDVLVGLNDQIVRITQALRLYSDVQGRVNFLTQRYQFLQEERQGRLNFARTVLSADDNQRYDLNRGFNLLQNLLGSGNLNLNNLNNDTDRRSVVSFLESARGISFNTQNGPQRSENILQQLLASLYGGQVLPGGADDELQSIQREIARRMDEASVALQGLANNSKSQGDLIANAIGEQNRIFLNELLNIFRNNLGAGVVGAAPNSNGGPIYANNGMLVNFQPKGTDTIPAMLTKGEYVVNAEAVRNNFHLIDYINKSRKPVYKADGGSTQDILSIREFQIQNERNRQENAELNRRRNPSRPFTVDNTITPLQEFNNLSSGNLFMAQIASQTSSQLRRLDFSGVVSLNQQRQNQLTDVTRNVNYNGSNVLSQLGATRDNLLNTRLLTRGEISSARELRQSQQNFNELENIRRDEQRTRDNRDRLRFRLMNPSEQIQERVQRPGFYPRFNFGGHVLGGDIVPAYLQNGEFVVNREQVNRIGAATLQSLGSNNSSNNSNNISPVNDSLVQAFNLFNTKSQPLIEAFNIFNKNSDKLVNALTQFPTSLTIEGRQTVEVIHNGAQVLSELNPLLQELIQKETKNQLQNMIDTKFPTLN